MKYLKIEDIPIDKNSKPAFWKAVLLKIVTVFIPKANPDFDNLIDLADCWLIEFDENGNPTREIGISTTRNILIKMPNERNFGYWTDNNLNIEDFKNNFINRAITQEEFEENWKKN